MTVMGKRSDGEMMVRGSDSGGRCVCDSGMVIVMVRGGPVK